MKKRLIVVMAGIAVVLAAVPLIAHHSFMAEYGGAQVTLTGKMIKFDWVNPHSWMYVEITNPDGTKVVWKGETPPVNVLYRLGWTKPLVETLVKKGEQVSMRGTPAKDGSNHVFASNVMLLTSGATMSLSGAPPVLEETK